MGPTSVRNPRYKILLSNVCLFWTTCCCWFFFLIFYLWVKDFVTILFQLHFGASSIHNGAISSAICITKSWSPSCLQLENQHILMTWYMRITIIIPRNILCLWEYLVMQVILFSDCEICLVYGVELFVVDLKINGR